MKDWQRKANRLLFPAIGVILVLSVCSAAALIAIFWYGWEETPIAYGVYVLAFYTLVIFCLACWKTIPGYYKYIRGKVQENPYAHRYVSDVEYKTKISLYGSLFINVIYIGTNAVSAVMYQTHWFAIFAVYYGIMAAIRFLLVRFTWKNTLGGQEGHFKELKCSRMCAYILLTVNLILSGVVLMMVYFNRGFQYQGVLIYVMAMYTFYITITAVRDVIKYRKYHSPVMSVTKIIKLASSLFSMLFLETAMFSQFGGDTAPEVKRIMIMATGAGISVIVVTMSVYMIVSSSKEIRAYRKER